MGDTEITDPNKFSKDDIKDCTVFISDSESGVEKTVLPLNLSSEATCKLLHHLSMSSVNGIEQHGLWKAQVEIKFNLQDNSALRIVIDSSFGKWASRRYGGIERIVEPGFVQELKLILSKQTATE